MERAVLHNFAEVESEALSVGPIRLAFLAPEDTGFMAAIKLACERRLVEPVFIGREQPMQAAAAKTDFNIGGFQKIYLDDLQSIATTGVKMLFSGEVDSVSKGQMSTNFVYRAVIKSEKQSGGQRLIAVTSFWEIDSLGHFVILTDPGVNIEPDAEAKIELIKKAISYLGLFGHKEPRVLALSAKREIDEDMRSHLDVQHIQKGLAAAGYNCTVKSGGINDIFTASPAKRPNILLMPHLVTGNSLVKMDFYLNVKRRGIILTSRGPVLIPSRADSSLHLVNEISLAVVVATRFKEGYCENFC